jgi:hypothetical protein
MVRRTKGREEKESILGKRRDGKKDEGEGGTRGEKKITNLSMASNTALSCFLCFLCCFRPS